MALHGPETSQKDVSDFYSFSWSQRGNRSNSLPQVSHLVVPSAVLGAGRTLLLGSQLHIHLMKSSAAVYLCHAKYQKDSKFSRSVGNTF